MDNLQKLQDLMLRYGLRRRDVAALLGKPLNAARGYSNSTVDRWLSGGNPVPEMALELLRLKLRNQPAGENHWQRLLHQPVPYASQRELEQDLDAALADLKAGGLPPLGRTKAEAPLKRAGYLLELAGHLGGRAFKPAAPILFARAARLHSRLQYATERPAFRSGDTPRAPLLDDLAARWGLAAGTDIRRFRQLAHTGRV